jgi:hypothetical protein
MSVSLDLAVATEASPPWQSRFRGEDVRGLIVAEDVNDSYHGDSFRIDADWRLWDRTELDTATSTVSDGRC